MLVEPKTLATNNAVIGDSCVLSINMVSLSSLFKFSYCLPDLFVVKACAINADAVNEQRTARTPSAVIGEPFLDILWFKLTMLDGTVGIYPVSFDQTFPGLRPDRIFGQFRIQSVKVWYHISISC